MDEPEAFSAPRCPTRLFSCPKCAQGLYSEHASESDYGFLEGYCTYCSFEVRGKLVDSNPIDPANKQRVQKIRDKWSGKTKEPVLAQVIPLVTETEDEDDDPYADMDIDLSKYR